jgi:hypothetical protein
VSTNGALQYALQRASGQIFTLIKSKLDDFFGLAEYDWTPPLPGARPSMYLEELFHWLMTVVDSLLLDDKYKDAAFKAALDHVAGNLMVRSWLTYCLLHRFLLLCPFCVVQRT